MQFWIFRIFHGLLDTSDTPWNITGVSFDFHLLFFVKVVRCQSEPSKNCFQKSFTNKSQMD